MSLSALWDLPAPAKLNLFLHVVGRRDDGYHLLQSPFVLIDWCDTLHFELRSDGALHRHDLGASLPHDDLCLRAARLLQLETQCAFGVDISIDKQLPAGAGMGGGSSDAATTLLALNRLWRLRLPRQRLLALALKLGADVSFFVAGHHAWVEGIGERLTPIVLAEQCFAVIKPAASIETKAIFQSPLLVRDTQPAILQGLLERTADRVDGRALGAEILAKSAACRNDLQPVAEALAPQVSEAAQRLKKEFGNSRMTGSGSAVFSRFEKTPDRMPNGKGQTSMATWPADELPPGWVGRICRSLPKHPLAGWAN